MGLVDSTLPAPNSVDTLNVTQESSSPKASLRNLKLRSLKLRALRFRRIKIERALRSRRLGTGVAIAAMGIAGASYGFVHTLNRTPVRVVAPTVQPVAAVTPTPAPQPKTHRFFHPLRGIASWYGSVLHGHPTASGEIFDESKLTACHNSLPFGTRVRVTDLNSNKTVVVRINDRGVLSKGRIIDLSSAAAEKLGILRSGIANVKLEVLKPSEAPAPASAD